MDLKNQHDKKLWDALLTSILQLCRIFWGPSEEFCRQMLEPSFLQPYDAIASRLETRWAAAEPHLMGDAAVRMRKTLPDLGISISDDVGEPPDHLSIELEVLYYLLTQDSGPDHRVSLKRAADFAAQSMIPWVKAFHLRLADEVRCRFYPLMTAVLLGVLYEVSTQSF